MFTGIIQAVGRIRDNEEIGDGLRIHVEAPELGLDTVKIGDSIAINGACMTVVEVDEKKFKVEVSAESLSKTAGLDGWGYVNLEKAMRLGDRLDGHIVEDTPAGTRISINLIPHTFEHTSFKYTKKRDLVNVEVDTVARYIERMYSLTEHK